MLNRRVHVLFDESDYVLMEQIASKRGISVGELIRDATKEAVAKKRDEELIGRKRKITELMKWRRKMTARNKKRKPLTVAEIKELINYGRRY